MLRRARSGPKRIQVVAAKAGDTVDTLARRMAFSSLQRERFWC
jgi:predicted Zn-dependent protease